MIWIRNSKAMLPQAIECAFNDVRMLLPQKKSWQSDSES
jgi:hypothetical protein